MEVFRLPTDMSAFDSDSGKEDEPVVPAAWVFTECKKKENHSFPPRPTNAGQNFPDPTHNQWNFCDFLC